MLHNTVNDMVEITIPHHKEWLRNHDERLKLLEEMLEEYSNDLDEGYGSLKDLFLKIASQINEDKHSEFIQDLVARVERLEDNFKVKIEKLVWSFQPVIKALFEAIEAQVREQEDNQCR
ncbi:MAG: hypothetical protein LBT38_12290 [Deltaproteobacteria bacterium]|nr:hypothetical protein [Deltaproteobacteria bacterium]